MTEPILEVQGLSRRFGGFYALRDVSFELKPKERLGLIGPNGSGKSTLVNNLCGAMKPDAGVIRFRKTAISGEPPHQLLRRGLARTFQLPRPFKSVDVETNVRVPILFAHRGSQPHATEADAEARCAELLKGVGLYRKRHASPQELSQVELRKLELARTMASSPDLLIADEPMAGLSNSEVSEILELLLELNGRGVAIILIEHVMRAVMAFSERLIVLVAGQKIADGDPSAVINDPEVVRNYLGG